ncbi:hypothetical protein DPMN_067859, partial [Dreissena polymorpha]
THAISCLSCKEGAEHLYECGEVIQCMDGQACFVERVMPLDGGPPKYLAGCRDMSLCNIDGCAAKETKNLTAVIKRSDIPVCSECCFHSLCNTQGCGGVFEVNSTSIRCFSCPNVYGNMSCNFFTLCDNKTQMCKSGVIDARENNGHPGAVALGCEKRNKCVFTMELYMNKSTPLEDQALHCCDSDLCNWKPLDDTGKVESIANKLTCPPDLVERSTNAQGITETRTAPITNTQRTTTATPPTTSTRTTPTTTPTTTATTTTTTPASTTTFTTSTLNPTLTSASGTLAATTLSPTTTTTATTPAPTTTSTTTTPKTTPITTEQPTTIAPATQTTEAPPFQLGTESTKCHQCTGPIQICEQIHFSKPCLYPNNYCINHITNHLDGTKTVNRTCGNFDTCYREWYLGTSDEDKCDVIKNNQHVDFQCTFCCIKNDCNVPLRPAEDSLYKPRMIG